MLNDSERRVLDIMSKKLLVTKEEIMASLNRNNPNDNGANLKKLTDLGYIEKVESIGTCFVITQKGMKTMRDM